MSWNEIEPLEHVHCHDGLREGASPEGNLTKWFSGQYSIALYFKGATRVMTLHKGMTVNEVLDELARFRGVLERL